MKAFEQLVTEQRDEVLLGYRLISDQFSDEILCHVDSKVRDRVSDKIELVSQPLYEAFNV